MATMILIREDVGQEDSELFNSLWHGISVLEKRLAETQMND
jgi:hypothetical protein